MRAIDTNVVVRLLARDDPTQEAIADKVVSEPFMLLPTVLMEAAWVLRSKFKLPRDEIGGRLRRLAGNENAFLVSANAVAQALGSASKGRDFADALHVALAAEAEASSFATFDQGIGKSANMPLAIETLS